MLSGDLVQYVSLARSFKYPADIKVDDALQW